MRAVVLAAGDGGRLGPYTSSSPKPLIGLEGRRIIDYTLDSLEESGVLEAVVVTGYLGDRLRETLSAGWEGAMDLRFVHNPDFKGGATTSLAAARTACSDEPFILAMADHLLSPPLIGKLVDAALDRTCCSFVAADFQLREAAYAHEATKLALDETGRVTAIGKDVGDWDALDTGAFYCRPEVWDALEEIPRGAELSVLFAQLAARGLLHAADVSGAFWYDIDTVEDLAVATALIAGGAA